MPLPWAAWFLPVSLQKEPQAWRREFWFGCLAWPVDPGPGLCPQARVQGPPSAPKAAQSGLNSAPRAEAHAQHWAGGGHPQGKGLLSGGSGPQLLGTSRFLQRREVFLGEGSKHPEAAETGCEHPIYSSPGLCCPLVATDFTTHGPHVKGVSLQWPSCLLSCRRNSRATEIRKGSNKGNKITALNLFMKLKADVLLWEPSHLYLPESKLVKRPRIPKLSQASGEEHWDAFSSSSVHLQAKCASVTGEL
ncbi:uncharacterized protein LOC108317238 isoform X1 [Cebus imitator]|uniref:uncharacterized protein LOC108317238 isoform X1 n=1 Tax=Cebus imitator TaxID=2715852 RepID=UPI000809EDAF|nr:uncharacterized protein LOC108317238 isoform X1 [Cebus imitator]